MQSRGAAARWVAIVAIAMLLTAVVALTPDPKPSPTPTSTSAPTPSKTVTVSSIADLLARLADDSVDEIVVANGRYHVSPSSQREADSLWIGAEFAGRRRPVTVRAQTREGVTFDGGGAAPFGCISFEDGAHDQTWDGFNCANGSTINTGVISVGGYFGEPAPHHITMRYLEIGATVTGNALTAPYPATEHAVYIAQAAAPGPHDLLFEDITVNGGGGLASAFHFDHADAANPNAWNVTVRRLHVIGTQQAIILWKVPLRDITFENVDIKNPVRYAVRYESIEGSGIVFSNITSSGSGSGQGFFSSQGPAPTGVTFINDSLH